MNNDVKETADELILTTVKYKKVKNNIIEHSILIKNLLLFNIYLVKVIWQNQSLQML